MRQLALAAVVAVDKCDRAQLVVNTAAITPTFGCLSLRQRAHSSLLLVKIITGHENRTTHYSKHGVSALKQHDYIGLWGGVKETCAEVPQSGRTEKFKGAVSNCALRIQCVMPNRGGWRRARSPSARLRASMESGCLRLAARGSVGVSHDPA